MSEQKNNPSPELSPGITPESEQRKRFALCWMQAQPIVAAYIGSAVRDRQHGEDLLQETALSIAESFDQYDTDRPFLSWAMGFARNKVLQHYRKDRKDRLVFDPELLSKIGTHFEQQADVIKQREFALAGCLEKLASQARVMIQMRYVQNMGYDQIAQAVDRSTAGVANNLYRSRKALADCISRETKRSTEGE